MPPKRLLLARRLWRTHRLVFLFAATILVPGALLAAFGIWALIQEKQLAPQRTRERLRAVGEAAGRRVELEFAAWQRDVERTGQLGVAGENSWPERIRASVAETGAAIVLLKDRGRLVARPAGETLYNLSASSAVTAVTPMPAAIAAAEALEFRGKDVEKAIAAYRQLLVSAKLSERAIVLHRLARSLKKAGREEEAVSTFRLLEKEPSVPIGSVPSDLLARFEVAEMERRSGATEQSGGEALALFRSVLSGAWRLDRMSYSFYADQLRSMLPPAAESARLVEIERRKLDQTEVAAKFLEGSRRLISSPDGYWLAFWSPDRSAVALLREGLLRSRVWPLVFGSAELRDHAISLRMPAGEILFGEAPPPGILSISHAVSGTEPPLRLQISPAQNAALDSGLRARENLFLWTLGAVMALLALGAYLVVRIVRAELAVAQIKSDFVSTVSHEFRSPLAGINQLGEMLRDGRVGDEARRQEYYEMIVQETQRLRRLVENILDFSRMEEGRRTYRFDPFEPAHWLRELVEAFQTDASRAGVTVEMAIPESLPYIVGDREALATALNNLLDNAVKYSRDSKIVWLEAGAENDGLSIRIRDRGVGIQEKDRPHIFEKFYRGQELASDVKGAGLGLNLVKHIVAAHRGEIDVVSKSGTGSTFTIHLPGRS